MTPITELPILSIMSREIIVRCVGISKVTLEKVEAIMEAAEEDPERFDKV